MINRRNVNENIFVLSNNKGDIAFGNKTGISYLGHCLEEKEIKKYAKENNMGLHKLPAPEFFVISCYVYTIEQDLK